MPSTVHRPPSTVLSLGYSPCPNDTFMFDAMVHGKIDTEGLSFEFFHEDVETLNRWAFEGRMDITKLSYHALGHLLDNYALLRSGSALGNNCGPLLIAKREMAKGEVEAAKIAIPGRYTTAHFLFNLAFPKAKNKVEMVFSDIENAVLSGNCEAGVIIHENRFTYQEKGLVKIVDLGELWESQTGLPIPLGGIVVRRGLDLETQQKIERVLRRSVEYAFAHPTEALPYIRQHAQEMDEAVMMAHINLYVNDFSVDLGEKGEAAVKKLYDLAQEQKIIPNFNEKIFIN